MTEYTKQIWQSFSAHHFLPGALGARAATLSHKTSTVLSQLKFEAETEARFEGMLSQIISFTTDLGVEQGLGDMMRNGLWSHLHECKAPAQRGMLQQEANLDEMWGSDSEQPDQAKDAHRGGPSGVPRRKSRHHSSHSGLPLKVSAASCHSLGKVGA